VGTLASKRPHTWSTTGCLIAGTVAWAAFVLWTAGEDGILLQFAGPATGLLGCIGLIVSNAWPE
jgi:hypothetical protein